MKTKMDEGVRGRTFITYKKKIKETNHKWFYCVCIASVKSYSMANVKQVVPSISSAMSAIEARNGNESQLKDISTYKN